MELTGQRRRPVADFTRRSTLSPQTQTTGCAPSGQGRTLWSPAASGGPCRSPDQGPASGQSGDLLSPSAGAGSGTGSGTGSAPGLLRQHSAPAGSRPRPPVARLARSDSGTTASGPFKRPVKQRLSPFGRGAQVTPLKESEVRGFQVAPPREVEFRGAQVAPLKEGEVRRTQVAPPRERKVRGSQVAPVKEGVVGRGLRSVYSPVGDGATSTHVELRQSVSEQKLVYGSTKLRFSEKRDDRLLSESSSAELSERRHYSSGVCREIAKVRGQFLEMKIVTQTKSPYGVEKTMNDDANSLSLRKEQTSFTENRSRNSISEYVENSKRRLQNYRRETHNSGSADKIPTPPDTMLMERDDENTNYLHAKRTVGGERQKMNLLTSHSEINRSSPRQPAKRCNTSFPEERVSKKPRHCELSWNSPDLSPLSCQSNTASEDFPEPTQQKTAGGWSVGARVSQRSSCFVSQGFDHKRRDDMSFHRRVGTIPPIHRMPHSTHGHGDQLRPRTSPFAGERTKRRPPLLPTPPSRFYSGGSPAVTTTTCLGEATPPVSQPSAVTPLGHHWATEMPLLPQLLEPLSPMSPLSVSSSPSPALLLSPLSTPSPSPHQPPSSPPDLSLQPPAPCFLERSRAATGRPRPTSNTDRLSDSDSDSDSDSAGGRVTCLTRASRPTASSRPRTHATDRDRFDPTHTDARRVNRERSSASRPGRPAVRSSGERSTTTPPPDRSRAERRPTAEAERRPTAERQQRAPTVHADRFGQQRSCGGRCPDECCADECVDSVSACPAPPSSRHRGKHRHTDVTRSRPGKTGQRRAPSEQTSGSRASREQLTSGSSTHDPPTTCDCEAHTDADGPGGDPSSAGGPAGTPVARDLSIFTSEYLSELLQLQRRIMTSRDSAKMARVLALLWETGHVQDTALYYDFDLCALDQGVVRQLQKCLN